MQGKKVIHIHVQEFENVTKVYFNGKIRTEMLIDPFETVVRNYTLLVNETFPNEIFTISSQPLHPHTYSECWGDTVVEDLKDTHLESPTCTLYVAGHGCEILHLKDGKFVAVNRYKRPGQARRERMLNLYHSYSECA